MSKPTLFMNRYPCISWESIALFSPGDALTHGMIVLPRWHPISTSAAGYNNTECLAVREDMCVEFWRSDLFEFSSDATELSTVYQSVVEDGSWTIAMWDTSRAEISLVAECMWWMESMRYAVHSET